MKTWNFPAESWYFFPSLFYFICTCLSNCPLTITFTLAQLNELNELHSQVEKLTYILLWLQQSLFLSCVHNCKCWGYCFSCLVNNYVFPIHKVARTFISFWNLHYQHMFHHWPIYFPSTISFLIPSTWKLHFILPPLSQLKIIPYLSQNLHQNLLRTYLGLQFYLFAFAENGSSFLAQMGWPRIMTLFRRSNKNI